MAKLYPPYIEGTIPAFYGTTLVVPFSMNRAVGINEISNIIVKIKKINNNEVVLTEYAYRFDSNNAYFKINQNLFNLGQFYRVQIAYIDKSNIIGYFSSVGVIKYTALPELEILNLQKGITNLHNYEYTGFYLQNEDPTEKMFSSRLTLYDSNESLIFDSGDIVHNTSNDVLPNRSTEKFRINRELKNGEIYRLIYSVITVNGLSISSVPYKLIQREEIDTGLDEIKFIGIKANPNFEEGSISINLYNLIEDKKNISGYFILSRSENIEPYQWEILQEYSFKSQSINSFYFNDYMIEQGKNYIYSFQQYNSSGIYSKRAISNLVYADFEDLFLLDGNKQLKIRFNPKVSSMKDNILETKTNTIGSKYPFFTRNGNVNHKEFSLSGLISYQMDDNKLFIDWKTLKIENNITDLISENIYAERIFKLEVLSWLNNGKPKILKSPVEGNYIVRIMGVSLSPSDTVGRMLHTFSCSATEMAPFNYEYLKQNNFIEIQTLNNLVKKVKTINLSETVINENGESQIVYKTGEILEFPITSFQITDMTPGSKLYINEEEIYIGVTGAYEVNGTEIITSIRIPEGAEYSGTINILYEENMTTDFDKIKAITVKEIPAIQIIGKNENIIDYFEDEKTKISNIVKVKFTKRGIHKIYIPYGQPINNNSIFYINGYSINDEYKIDLSKLDPLSLYEIHYSSIGIDKITDEDGIITYYKDENIFIPFSGMYYDAYHNTIINDNNNLFDIQINNEFINLQETEEKIVKNIDFKQLAINAGIIAELMLFLQVVEYSNE